jgi:hypothetical protein
MKRLSFLIACAAASFGCMDIRETPATTDGGASGGSGGSGAGGEAGSSFDPDACVAACLTGPPAANALFETLGGCYAAERSGECGTECAPAAPMSEATSSCPIPGSVDPNPGCNACLKDTCCEELQGCLANSGCLSIALCAANCQ